MTRFSGLTKNLLGFITILLAAAVLASCGGKSATRSADSDGPSHTDIKASDVKDAVPSDEPLARYGNHSPYEVFGKKYTVMSSSSGYHEQGVASWYGSKFHGRRTSSGEIYDMHLATAAHKSLPLPTYAEVTNLDNGRKVIVKINDRGPFKGNRIIDMSYGAALRLGMIGSGTANVDVRALTSSSSGSRMVAAGSTGSAAKTNAADGHGIFLQMGAFDQRDGAESLVSELRKDDMVPVSINKVPSKAPGSNRQPFEQEDGVLSGSSFPPRFKGARLPTSPARGQGADSPARGVAGN